MWTNKLCVYEFLSYLLGIYATGRLGQSVGLTQTPQGTSNGVGSSAAGAVVAFNVVGSTVR